jgi:hypothetical protein
VAVVLVALSMFTMAVSGTDSWSRMLALVVEGVTLLFILWTSAVRPQALRLAVILVVAAIVIAGISLARGGEFAAESLNGVGIFLALGAPVAIVRHLLVGLRITFSTVLGALCVYLLGGLFFAYLFALADAHQQGHFFVQVTNPPSVDYLYFSLVTLTTVGYGDLTASGSLGKMLAVTEALAGQLYLVSIVAVLVSNIGHERTPRHADRRARPPDDSHTG